MVASIFNLNPDRLDPPQCQIDAEDLLALLVGQDGRRHPDIAVYLSLGMLLERDVINCNGLVGCTAAKGQKEETIKQ